MAESNQFIYACLVEGLRVAGLATTAIGRVPTTDRAANRQTAERIRNASGHCAQFAEGEMDTQIGIATGKFHARGRLSVEPLTNYKYLVRGAGQVRP